MFIDQMDNKRKIAFGISGTLVTKDTAGLGTVEIPDATTQPDEFNTIMQVIIAQTKAAIVGHSENNEAYFAAIDKLHEVETVEQANDMLKLTKTLAKNFQVSFFTLAKAELAKKGFEFSVKDKAFVKAGEEPKAKKEAKKETDNGKEPDSSHNA